MISHVNAPAGGARCEPGPDLRPEPYVYAAGEPPPGVFPFAVAPPREL